MISPLSCSGHTIATAYQIQQNNTCDAIQNATAIAPALAERYDEASDLPVDDGAGIEDGAVEDDAAACLSVWLASNVWAEGGRSY